MELRSLVVHFFGGGFQRFRLCRFIETMMGLIIRSGILSACFIRDIMWDESIRTSCETKSRTVRNVSAQFNVISCEFSDL